MKEQEVAKDKYIIIYSYKNLTILYKDTNNSIVTNTRNKISEVVLRVMNDNIKSVDSIEASKNEIHGNGNYETYETEVDEI